MNNIYFEEKDFTLFFGDSFDVLDDLYSIDDLGKGI